MGLKNDNLISDVVLAAMDLTSDHLWDCYALQKGHETCTCGMQKLLNKISNLKKEYK